MSRLLKEIKKINSDAARTLEGADLRTDRDIQSLTREDLRDLFPHDGKFKLRRQIFDIIHTQNPINLLLRDIKAFIPEESLRAAVTEDGLLADYLKILKDTKTQLTSVQAFLEAHIDLLESISTNPTDPEPYRGFPASPPANYQTESEPKTSLPPTCGSVDVYKAQNTVYPQGGSGLTQSPSHSFNQQRSQVKCSMVVTGKTFDAHLQLLEKVRSNCPHLDVVCRNVEDDPYDQDYQVTIVFCPIISRIGTDVEAAMRHVTGDKPVLLVIMEHKPEATSVSTMRSWHDDPRIVLHVCVFFHERKPGLLQCHHNNEAVLQVQGKLLEYSIKINRYTSGNSQERTRKPSRKDSNADSSGVRSWLPFMRS